MKTGLSLGEIISGEITDLTREGHGFLKAPDGRSVFVPGAWPGDQGEFEIDLVEKRYATAKIHKLQKTSPDRRSEDQIPCKHFGLKDGQCGGCLWMPIKDEAQAAAKEKLVKDTLSFKKIPLPENFEFWPSSKTLQYRNRAQFKTDGQKIGYVSRGTKILAEIEKCLILNSKTAQLFQAARTQLPREDWRPDSKFKFSFLDLDDQMTVEDIKINQRRSFRQANDEQNNKMKMWIESKSKNWQGDLLELFSGSGNFTLNLAKNINLNILAVESVGAALEAIKGVDPNVQILELDLYQSQSLGKLTKEMPMAKHLFLDPPRDGFRGLSNLAKNLPELENIIYVSCNLDSFSKDAADLVQNGFQLLELKALDQFPQTPHIELLALFGIDTVTN